ncbi:MAG: pesticin C-terminus-like muramidase [Treponema sp.]|jgi:hypothetical protein|nr:pesticin C-terminus-like muramidase [Treponema sp.]
MIHSEYIGSVLARFEGRAVCRGYVPCAGGTWYPGGPGKGEPLGASGVTVATGVDLGQQTAGGLAGLPADLVKKLLPYLGLKRREAVEKLRLEPLVISAGEAAAIDRVMHDRYTGETAVLFGREAFDRAPPQAQAVAVSLHYQFGTPFREASPALGYAWKALRGGCYRAAAKFLRGPDGWSADHRQYLPRRRAEAALLDEIAAA